MATRGAAARTLQNLNDDRAVLEAREERVEVEKKPVVTERVAVGKRTTEEDERIDTTVRKENIKVDKRGRGDMPRTSR